METLYTDTLFVKTVKAYEVQSFYSLQRKISIYHLLI